MGQLSMHSSSPVIHMRSFAKVILAYFEMIHLRRLAEGPIIHSGMLPGKEGDNINGPSLILAPDWLPGRLGKFYLYFAHHRGQHIRLAYADHLEGPWTVFAAGSLQLEDATACRDHIASPDVHVDHEKREILMFFHGVSKASGHQKTFVARSRNGVDFSADEVPIADFYFRTIQFEDYWIGISKGGVMYTAAQLAGDYKKIPTTIFAMRHPQGNAPGDLRHAALTVSAGRLHVYFSQIGDAPESIYRSSIALGGPVEHWIAEGKEIAMQPQADWEGADLPIAASRSGAAKGREKALRDPAVFVWESRTYLLYCAAGESSIGIAEVAG